MKRFGLAALISALCLGPSSAFAGGAGVRVQTRANHTRNGVVKTRPLNNRFNAAPGLGRGLGGVEINPSVKGREGAWSGGALGQSEIVDENRSAENYWATIGVGKGNTYVDHESDNLDLNWPYPAAGKSDGDQIKDALGGMATPPVIEVLGDFFAWYRLRRGAIAALSEDDGPAASSKKLSSYELVLPDESMGGVPAAILSAADSGRIAELSRPGGVELPDVQIRRDHKLFLPKTNSKTLIALEIKSGIPEALIDRLKAETGFESDAAIGPVSSASGNSRFLGGWVPSYAEAKLARFVNQYEGLHYRAMGPGRLRRSLAVINRVARPMVRQTGVSNTQRASRPAWGLPHEARDQDPFASNRRAMLMASKKTVQQASSQLLGKRQLYFMRLPLTLGFLPSGYLPGLSLQITAPLD